MINDDFKRWALNFGSCDGGDIGSPKNPSIWLCGLEWGGGFKEEELQNIFKNNDLKIPAIYEDCKENLKYQFNIKAIKLLAAINGEENHVKFNETFKPFSRGGKGYFKMNLYPLSFKDTNHNRWTEAISKETGFKDKDEYIKWIRLNRFPIFSSWAKEYRPKIIICTGISYKDDFIVAFGDQNTQLQERNFKDYKKFFYFKNSYGALVVIIYFLGGRHGLKSDEEIRRTGKEIAKIYEAYLSKLD